MDIVFLGSLEKKIRKMLSDKAFSAFLDSLSSHPGVGKRIKGSKYLRKARIADESRGKRGSYRVVYFLVIDDEQIAVVDFYAKNKKEDLSQKEIKNLDALCKKYIES